MNKKRAIISCTIRRVTHAPICNKILMNAPVKGFITLVLLGNPKDILLFLVLAGYTKAPAY